MSVEIDLGSFKSRADKRLKEKQYLDMLHKRDIVNIETQIRLNPALVPTPPSPYLSTAELLRDLGGQRKLAIENLATIMPKTEASETILKYFTDINSLNEFNGYWGVFEEQKLKGRRFIEPNTLYNMWVKFKNENLEIQPVGTSQQTVIVDNYPPQQWRTADMLKGVLTKAEIKSILEQKYGIPETALNYVGEEGIKPLSSFNDWHNLYNIFKTRDTAGVMFPAEEFVEQGYTSPPSNSLLEGTPSRKKGLKRTTVSVARKKTPLQLLKEEASMKGVAIPTGMKKAAEIRTLIDRYSGSQSQPLTMGYGIKFGSGISPPTEEKYVEFGKYVVNILKLKKNVLVIRYKSGNQIPNLPSQLINDELKLFMEDLLSEKRMNNDMYNKLSNMNKRFVDRLSQQAGVEKILGIKIDDNERKNDIQRFEVLKGEVSAGNDSPELLRELKQHVLKFLADGTMPKQQGYSLLYELSVIS